jgi:hypothetical protein
MSQALEYLIDEHLRMKKNHPCRAVEARGARGMASTVRGRQARVNRLSSRGGRGIRVFASA